MFKQDIFGGLLVWKDVRCDQRVFASCRWRCWCCAWLWWTCSSLQCWFSGFTERNVTIRSDGTFSCSFKHLGGCVCSLQSSFLRRFSNNNRIQELKKAEVTTIKFSSHMVPFLRFSRGSLKNKLWRDWREPEVEPCQWRTHAKCGWFDL